MTDLTWHKSPEGFESDGYLIRRLEGRPNPQWRLEVRAAPSQGTRQLTMSVHSTVKQAKDRAAREESERIRRARVVGHLLVGMASTFVFIPLVANMRRFWVLIAVLTVLIVALRSFADAVGVWLGDAWGWTRDRGGPEYITRSGRWVLNVMDRLQRRSWAAARAEPESAIIILPPQE